MNLFTRRVKCKVFVLKNYELVTKLFINKRQTAPTIFCFQFRSFIDKSNPNIKGNLRFPLATMAVFLSNYVFPTRYTQIHGAQTRLPTLILPCITPCLDTDLFGVFSDCIPYLRDQGLT